ncbi:MOD1, partial [Symbiodinium microadriaticum]
MVKQCQRPCKEDEEMRFGPREGDEDGDEAVQEVRRGLRPITASEQVIRAMKEVDDFRMHEESGKYSLHPPLRRELFKVHRNLGHPAKDVFLRALKHSGTREDVLQWTKEHFRCPLCEASRRPSSARPAHLAKTLQFNAIMAIDLFYLNLFGAERVFLVCVDHGTGLVQAALCADARSTTVKDVFATTWIEPFGHPELVISDLGPEFFGEPFQEYLASAGTALHFTDAMSPWQNGRAERAVQSVKSKLKTVIADTTATLDELEICLTQALSLQMIRWVQEAAGDEMKRTWEIREAAQLAWLKKSDQAAVQKARRVLTRKSDEKSAALHPGQWVYVWRRTENKYGWTGPGSLVAPCPGGNSWWLNMKDRLWKVNVEQLRSATNEENLGAAMAQELHRDLLRQLREGVHNGYQDVTKDGSPEDFADIEPSEAEEDIFPLQASQEQPLPEPMVTEPDVAESTGDTTTLGDELSDLVVPSDMQDSRRHSVQSASTEAGPPPSERRTIRVDEGSSGTMSFGPVRPTSSTSTSAPYATSTENTEVVSSEYLEVMDPDFDEDAASSNYVSVRGPRWIKQTSSGRTWLEPLKPMVSFAAHEGELNYCRRDRCMYAAKAKTSFGQVEFGRLPEAEKKVFRASRAKEFKSLLDNKAIRVLTLEESREFRKRHPESILESRFVDRFKPLDVKQEDLDKVKKAAIETGQLAPLELATDFSSPKSRWCVVGWKDPLIHQIERSAPTPAGNAVNTVLQLAASRRWTTFVRDVKTAFLQSRPTDRATPLACTQPKDEPLPELHPEQLILLLTEEITFGKVEDLQESETSYAGKMIKQNDDFSFTIHMEPYIYTRMAPVVLARKVLKRGASKVVLTDFEQTQLRGAIASIAWASRECRPDVAASILAGAFPEPTADTVFHVNDVIKHLKQHPLKLKIHAIPEAKVRNLLVADAAFDTSGQEKSQHGYLLGFTDHTLNNGHSAPVSLIMWRSKRLRRRASSSSMLYEALSLSAASASLEKQDALWSALRVSNYDPRARQRSEEEVLELQGRSTVVATDSAAYRDPRSVIVIDAKSLYDHWVRWVPHNCNPSDALTKFPGAHVEPMIRLLKTHRYQVCDE